MPDRWTLRLRKFAKGLERKCVYRGVADKIVHKKPRLFGIRLVPGIVSQRFALARFGPSTEKQKKPRKKKGENLLWQIKGGFRFGTALS